MLSIVPERIGYLILLFLHRALTTNEHQELNDWVGASDQNMETFEQLSDVDKIVSHDRLPGR